MHPVNQFCLEGNLILQKGDRPQGKRIPGQRGSEEHFIRWEQTCIKQSGQPILSNMVVTSYMRLLSCLNEASVK